MPEKRVAKQKKELQYLNQCHTELHRLIEKYKQTGMKNPATCPKKHL
jgi:uncharacterized coiled-coil protein SlyX